MPTSNDSARTPIASACRELMEQAGALAQAGKGGEAADLLRPLSARLEEEWESGGLAFERGSVLLALSGLETSAERAARASEMAGAIFDSLSGPEAQLGRARSRVTAARADWRLGRHQQALEKSAQGLEMLRSLDSPREYLLALLFHLQMLTALGRTAEAAPLAAMGVELARRVGDAHLASLLLQRQTELSPRRGAGPLPSFAGSGALSGVLEAMRIDHQLGSAPAKDFEAYLSGDDEKEPIVREASSASAPAEPVFHFEIEGSHARQNRILGGSDFDLLFAFGEPGGEALALVVGRELDEARTAGVALDVVVLPPPGFAFRDGRFCQRARFRDGRLEETLRFRLRAPLLPAAEGEHRLWVRFSRQGRKFYQLPLDLELVRDLGAEARTPCRPPAIDLDRLLAADLGDRKPRLAQLVLRRTRGDIRVSCSLLAEAGAGEESPGATFEVERFDALALENQIGLIKGCIERGFLNLGWTEAEDLLAQDVSGVPGANESLEQLATAGYQLRSFLAQDPAMRRILEAIEKLPPDSILDVQTDNVFLPWEILNPHQYDAGWSRNIKFKRGGFQPQDFWGYRFQIESKPLASFEDPGGPPSGRGGPTFVSLNLNPSIDEEAAYRRLAPGASHLLAEQALRRHGRCAVHREGGTIFEELSLPTEPVTFLYLFCHGRRENPFQIGGGEQLELEKGITVTPGALDTGEPFTQAPIVMLNSCSSGAVSPLQFDSFLRVFKKRGACGLVATTFPVPTVFAAAFGRAVLEAYAAGDRNIGEILHQLRRQLLEKGNPLGLLYTLQCPLEARAPGPEPANARSAA